MDDASFAQLIRDRRRELELTQIQLALCARVSLSTVRLAERGIASVRTLDAIARAAGLSLDQLRAHHHRSTGELGNG